MTAPLAPAAPDPRPPRLRDFGHVVGGLAPGAWNALTDVPGVRVGHTTLRDDARGLHSGVTAIVPDALVGQAGRSPLCAGLYVGNGCGTFVGATQVAELGEIETPVLLTSTMSTFRAADALLTWLLDRASDPPNSLNPVVGEINDSWLSQADPRPVTAEHVHAALDSARAGPVAAGSVGGGTGACALGYKAGIGTASRILPLPTGASATVGVLVQANMGGELRLGGRVLPPSALGLPVAGRQPDLGSCVVVVATDLACSARELTRVATRGVFGLGRVGASFAHGSGDYGLAFSTSTERASEPLPLDLLDLILTATMDAVEEAVVDALLAASTVRTPTGRAAHALPHTAVRRALT